MRPLRIEYPGAWYHVMNRGLEKKPIFLCNKHKQYFLSLLAQISDNFKVEVHAYCLMENHYHLLMHTPFANLSRAMQYLNGVYAQRFNVVQDRCGPLFQGRYKAILVDSDEYLLTVSRYIHLNPVDANIVYRPEHFRWSSYRAYLLDSGPSWLHKEEILNCFQQIRPHKEYKLFVEQHLEDENILYGSEKFRKKIQQDYIESKHKTRETPQYKKLQESPPSVSDIFQIVADYYQINIDSLNAMQQGKKNIPRAVAIYLARYEALYKFSDIAKSIRKMTASSVSQTYRRFCKEIISNQQIKNDINKIKIKMGSDRNK